MPRNGYPFLQKNRKLERDKRDEEIAFLRRQLAVIGNVGGAKSFNTGFGEDGQLQPNMPTHMLQTNAGPRTIHEGEDVEVGNDGQFSVTPAEQSSGMQSAIPGFRYGTQPTSKNYIDITKKSVSDAIIPASQFGGQRGLRKAEAMGRVPGYAIGTPRAPFTITGLTPPPTKAPTATVTPTTTIPLINTSGATAINPNLSRPTEAVSTGVEAVAGAPKFNSAGRQIGTWTQAEIDARAIKTPDTATIPDAATPDSQYIPIVNRGLQRLERYAEGQDPFAAKIREEELGRFKGEESAARGALAQELAQAGIGGREALTAQARQGRQIGADQAEVLSQLRKGEADRAFQAATQIPSEARASEQLDFMKQQWGDQEGTRMANDAQVMDEATWLKAHPNATSADYARAKTVTDRTFEEGVRQFDVVQGNWEKNFGITQANQMATDASTMSKETWLAKYPNMKPEDYDMASRMSNIIYETNAHTLTELRNSYTGKQVYDYYQSHPDTSWRTDSGAKQALVVHYDELGGEAALGDFAPWADNQEKALTDPRVNTLIGQYSYDLDRLVGSGIISEEDSDDMLDFFTDFSSGKLQMKRIWTVGESEFDSEQAAVDYANTNNIPLTDVKNRWTAIDQTTGEVYGGTKTPEGEDESTQISATSYGVLNGLSYGTGDLTGNLANGESFSTDGAMKIGAFGYNIPKGTYTVKTDDDGNVWYKNEDGKYYLASVKDAAGVNIIKANTELMSKISAGMNEPSLGDVDLKPEKVEFSPTDMKIGQTFDAKEGSLFGPPEGYVGPLQINNVQPHGPYPEYNEYGITDLGSGKTYSILPMVRASDGKFLWYYKGWTQW